MSNYERLVKLIENNVTYLDNLNTEPDTISPIEFNKGNKRKPGRPKVKPMTPIETILEEYKKLEMSYNLLEIEYQIALNEIESLKLQSKKQELTKSMQKK